jgi:hypothetical protein
MEYYVSYNYTLLFGYILLADFALEDKKDFPFEGSIEFVFYSYPF